MSKTNKNENPLRSLNDLNNQVKWSDYDHREYFTHVCTLQPDHENERLNLEKLETHSETEIEKIGLVYVMVIDDRIFKIGQSILTFPQRLGSYNTGKASYRSRGTNSGANFFILQSILHINLAVEIYGFFPEHKTWEVLGEDGKEAFPSAKVAEKIFLRRFKETYKKLPIGCGQG